MPNAQQDRMTQQALARDLIAGLFWLLAFVQLVNLNHIANMVYGSGLLVTAGLLAICVALIALVPVRLRPVLGFHGICMIVAVGSYGVIATAVALLTGTSWEAYGPWAPFRPWLAITVTIASAAGGTFLLRHYGVAPLLVGVLIILGTTAALIFASPWLAEHVYASLDPAQVSYFFGRRRRYAGTFINPIQAGMAACNAVAVALAILGHVRETHRRLLAGGVVIMATVAIAFTVSRTPVLALGLLFVLFLFSARSRLPRGRGTAKMFVAALVGLMLLAVVYRETSLVSYQLMDRLTLTNEREWLGIAQRLQHLIYGFDFIVQSPLVGNGLTQLESMRGAQICQYHALCGTHNSFLQYWGEAGIGPVLLLVIAFVAFLAKAWRVPRSLARDTAFGWVLVFALHCLVADAVPHNYLWYSFLFGLSCALLAHAAAESPPAPR